MSVGPSATCSTVTVTGVPVLKRKKMQRINIRPEDPLSPADPEGERRDDEKEWENNYGAIIARAGPKVKSASSNHLDNWRFSSEPVTKLKEREKREHVKNAYDTEA